MEMTDLFSLLITYRDVRSENFAANGDVKRVDFLTFFSRFSHEKTMRISKAFSPRFGAVFVTFSHILTSLREARSEKIGRFVMRWRYARAVLRASHEGNFLSTTHERRQFARRGQQMQRKTESSARNSQQISGRGGAAHQMNFPSPFSPRRRLPKPCALRLRFVASRSLGRSQSCERCFQWRDCLPVAYGGWLLLSPTDNQTTGKANNGT
jgi:hypothetical protein